MTQKSRITRLLAGTVLAAGITCAAEVQIGSVGTAADPGETTDQGPSLAIDKHPDWANPFEGTSWTSYAITGDPSAPGYVILPNGVAFTWIDSVQLDDPVISATLKLMADDGAVPIVNGNVVPLSGQAPMGGNCADPNGCSFSTASVYDIAPYLATGTNPNTISIQVGQCCGGSVGLDVSVSILTDPPAQQAAETPEPSTWALIAGGFLTLIGAARKRK